MSDFDFDLFTIGAGSGGVRASRIAAIAGAKVGLAEEYRIGGTCVIRGCVPKKLLVYGSEFAQTFKDAEGFGWSVEGARFDWGRLRDAVQAEVTRLSGLYAANLAKAGVETFEDRAEILDPHTVRLVRCGRTIRTRRILVATGGRPVLPDAPGAAHLITSNEAFHLEHLPKSVLIAGGGYIAVEFANIFHGLGAAVTVLYRGHKLLNGFDEDVRAHVQAEMERTGVRVITGAIFERIEKTAAGLVATLSDGQIIAAETMMAAIGRLPYTEGLGLDRAGVALDDKGAVIVDAYSRTNVDSVFAIGDVTNRVNLTPIAIREGHALADTLFNDRPTSIDYDDIPTAVFSRPPVGSVGLTEAEARARHGAVQVFRTTFRPMKNILAGNGERTLMKLIVEKAGGRVVGVHVAGEDGPEMIQLAAIAVKAGLTKAQWDATVALHPTAAEELVLLREPVQS